MDVPFYHDLVRSEVGLDPGNPIPCLQAEKNIFLCTVQPGKREGEGQGGEDLARKYPDEGSGDRGY